jgi:hypothetical protein
VERVSIPVWRKSAGWLSSINPDDRDGLGEWLRILLGLWICQSVAPAAKTAQAMRHIMVRVERQLDLLDTTVDRSYVPQFDVKLLLLGQGILAAHNYRVGNAALFAQRLAHALLALPIVPVRYVGELLLLTRLGYLPTMALRASTALPKLVTGPIVRLLTAPREEVRKSCSAIAAATRFGNAAPIVDRRIPTALTAIALQSLSDYDLDLATILLRSVKYLGMAEQRSVAFAVEFLLDQQREDGGMGFLAIELARIARNDEPLTDPTAQVLLPTTVSVLWTLKEILIPDSNLYKDFTQPLL